MKARQGHTIIWDWNGTLLDDTEVCIRSMNRMLQARGLPVLSLQRYREVFTFPVIDYYKTIGFDFSREPWDEAALEFIDLYLEALPSCKLASGATALLSFFREQGFQQAIISAMQHNALVKSVTDFDIQVYFDYIGGIGDHFGSGKTENARQFFRDFKLVPSRVTLLGDSLHDAEVAKEVGCDCILVSAGHQSHERLLESGFTVVKSLYDIIAIFT